MRISDWSSDVCPSDLRLALVPVILPLLDGVVAALEAGADVCDVGCGSGVALEAMARPYPRSRFTGYDPSRHAVERAPAKLARSEESRVGVEWSGACGCRGSPDPENKKTQKSRH